MNDAGISGDLQVMEDFLFPLGRARELPKKMFYWDPNEVKESGCNDAGRSIVVLPTRELSFCCGHLFNSMAQDLTIIGRLGEGENLAEMIGRMQRNVLYWWLHLRGPFEIANKLGIDISKSQCRSCEMCYILATQHMSDLESLADNKEDIFKTLTTIKTAS